MALHLACANGHAKVVTLLAEQKCHLNSYDGEYRTPLMKAIQCQEEECVSVLLHHGADPDIADASGNTALHYAVHGQNILVADKLLCHKADIAARNKNDRIPLLLAIREKKEQMVEFLTKKEGNIHAVDKAKRLSNKHVIDDSWPTSDDKDLDYDTKSISESVPEKSFASLCEATEQKGKNILNGQVEDVSGELDFKRKSEEEQERLDGSENDQPQVVVRQLQQELADTLKKQPMSEASLEVKSHYHVNLDETQSVKEKLSQIICKLQAAQAQLTKTVPSAERTQKCYAKI